MEDGERIVGSVIFTMVSNVFELVSYAVAAGRFASTLYGCRVEEMAGLLKNFRFKIKKHSLFLLASLQ
jgi:hypothetical protein